jgi:hypothetical protein
LIPADDELDREMYSLACDKLEKYGFKQYEISNFARPGFECRHNLIYWNIGKYIGIGAGAHSYLRITGLIIPMTCLAILIPYLPGAYRRKIFSQLIRARALKNL